MAILVAKNGSQEKSALCHRVTARLIAQRIMAEM